MNRYIVALVLFVTFTFGVSQDSTKQNPKAPRKSIVLLAVDATSSLDEIAYNADINLREAFLQAAKDIIVTATDSRESVEVIILRICGLSELTYKGTISKHDYPGLSTLLERKLSGCELAPSPDVKSDQMRISGTDLTSTFQSISKLLKRYDNHEAIMLVATDGYSQPPEKEGEFDNESAMAELRAMAEQIDGERVKVTHFSIIGLHESLYLDWDITAYEAFPDIGRGYGVADMAQGLQEFLASIRGAK